MNIQEKNNEIELIKQNVQERLRHYLRMHRKRHNLNVSEMSEKLEYTLDHYRKFESRSTNNRFVSAVEFIASFAKIEGMSFQEFINYIFPQPVMERASLYPWEKILIKTFDAMDVACRSEFCHSYCSEALEDQSKLERMERILGLALELKNLDSKQIEAIETIIKSMNIVN